MWQIAWSNGDIVAYYFIFSSSGKHKTKIFEYLVIINEFTSSATEQHPLFQFYLFQPCSLVRGGEAHTTY